LIWRISGPAAVKFPRRIDTIGDLRQKLHGKKATASFPLRRKSIAEWTLRAHALEVFGGRGLPLHLFGQNMTTINTSERRPSPVTLKKGDVEILDQQLDHERLAAPG